VLLRLRVAPKEESNSSSAEQVKGTRLLLPGQMHCVGDMEKSPSFPTLPTTRARSNADVAVGLPPPHLKQAHFVYVRRGGCAPSLAPAYVGPYEVIKKTSKMFTLHMGTRKEMVSMDHLKAHTGEDVVTRQQPPGRGRPWGTSAQDVQPSSASS
jgi:hypothetical protein